MNSGLEIKCQETAGKPEQQEVFANSCTKRRVAQGNRVDAARACLGWADSSFIFETMWLGTESLQGFALQATVSSSCCAQSCFTAQ